MSVPSFRRATRPRALFTFTTVLAMLLALAVVGTVASATSVADAVEKPAPGMLTIPAPTSDTPAPLLEELRQAKRAGDVAAAHALHETLGWTSEARAGDAATTAATVTRAVRRSGLPGGPDPLLYDQLVNQPAWSSGAPAIASTNDGVLYAVVEDLNGAYLDIYRSDSGGYSWTYELSLTGVDPVQPAIAIAEGNENRLLVVYVDGSTTASAAIKSFRMDIDTGTSATSTIFAQAYAVLSDPHIALDSPEYAYWYPYVTWIRGTVGRGVSYGVDFSRSLDYGETWTSSTTLATSATSDLEHDVDFGASTLHVAYTVTAAPGNRDVYLRRSTDFGGSFAAGSGVATASQDEYEPTVGATRDGSLVAVAFTKAYTVSNTDAEAVVSIDGTSWSLTYLPYDGLLEGQVDLAASENAPIVHAVYRRDPGRVATTSMHAEILSWDPAHRVNESALADPTYGPAVVATPVRAQEAGVVWTTQGPDAKRVMFDADYPVGDLVVVLADPSLATAVAGYRSWKESIGYRVVVTDVPAILAAYPSGDDAERIFAYLADHSDATRHVMLVGDVDLLPMRLLYPDDKGLAYGSDFYYASVGTLVWDSDGDDRWGEFVDDGLDPNPDLIVARLPFDDATSVEAACTNMVAFEQATGAWKRSVVLANGFMDHVENTPADPVTDAAYSGEATRADCLTPMGWGSTRLYEEGGISTSVFTVDTPLSQTAYRAELGWGMHGIVNNIAHGNPTGMAGVVWDADLNESFTRDLPEEWSYNWFSNSGDISTDPAAGVVCLWGCSTAHLFGQCNAFSSSPLRSRFLIRETRSDMMLKEYLRNGAGAVIAATAGSDYGAGWTTPAQGHQQSLAYYLFSEIEGGRRRMGDAFHAAAARYASTHGLARGIRVFHAFGDPTLSLDDVEIPAGAERVAGPVAAHVTVDRSGTERGGDCDLPVDSVDWSAPVELPGGMSIQTFAISGYDLFAGGISSDETGTRGSVYHSPDGGLLWTRHDVPGARSIRVIEPTRAGALIAAGMSEEDGAYPAAIYRSTDGAVSWTPTWFGVEGVVTDVVERADGRLVAVTGWDGEVLESEDDGESWMAIADLGPGVSISSISEVDGELFATLDAPMGLSPVLHSSDGASWGPVAGLETVEAAYDLVRGGDGDLYAGVRDLGGAGVVYRSSTAGELWEPTTEFPDPGAVRVRTLLEGPDGSIYAGASSALGVASTRVYRLEPGGTDWERVGSEVDLANDVHAMTVYGPNVYAGTGDLYGRVYLISHGVLLAAPATTPEIALRVDAVAPNPFTTTTAFRYTIGAPADVTLDVFDAMGRLVRQLTDHAAAGSHTIGWDGTNAAGEAVSTGVYFYRLRAGGLEERGRVVVAR